MIPNIISPPPDAPKLDFMSLKGVKTLFNNASAETTLVAWVHYLVFDLWTGMWIATDYQNSIQFSYGTKAYEIASLFLTLMFGPVGLLTYLGGKYSFLPQKVDHTKD